MGDLDGALHRGLTAVAFVVFIVLIGFLGLQHRTLTQPKTFHKPNEPNKPYEPNEPVYWKGDGDHEEPYPTRDG